MSSISPSAIRRRARKDAHAYATIEEGLGLCPYRNPYYIDQYMEAFKQEVKELTAEARKRRKAKKETTRTRDEILQNVLDRVNSQSYSPVSSNLDIMQAVIYDALEAFYDELSERGMIKHD